MEAAAGSTRMGLPDVSRETSERLACLVAELQRWQTVKNLVGRGTLDQVWSRHIDDSLQLFAYRGLARTWLDLGSGAGFPGLVVAIAGRDERPVRRPSSRATPANALFSAMSLA